MTRPRERASRVWTGSVRGLLSVAGLLLLLPGPILAQADFDHTTAFSQLSVDWFYENQHDYDPSTLKLWYIRNYDFAKYSGYQDLLDKFDRHLPTGRGLTVLQAENTHTADDIGDVKHLFDYEDSSSHSERVAGFLSRLETFRFQYTKYSTFSVDLDSFHTADTEDLRAFFPQMTSGSSYPATSYDGLPITPAKLLNVSNTNGGSSAPLVRQFDKFVEENDMVACTAHSSLPEGNWTTSGMAYNSIVVDQYYGNPNNFDGAKLNDHGSPRYKPDLIARSAFSSSTSYSAPTVCSAAAMLLERASVDDAVANATSGVVVKAILMAGATRFDYRISLGWSDIQEIADPPIRGALPLFYYGEWQRTSDALPTSPKYGAGHLNVLAAYDILDAGEFDAGGTEAVGSRGWDYADGLAEANVNTYQLAVAQESMFSAVLVWHRYIDDDFVSYLPDYEVSVYDNNGMRVAHSDSLTSNVELVEVKLAAGTYRLEVTVKSDGDSAEDLSYGLAWIAKEIALPPQTLNIESLSDSWELSWDVGGAEAGYKYRLQVSAGAQFSTIEKDVYLDVATYTYPPPADERTRYFRVFTYPQDGNVAYFYPSSPRSIHWPPPPPPPPPPPRGGGGGGLLFPPEAPLGLMAMPGDGAVRLEWSPPESDGGTPILRYEYRLKEGRGEFGEWTSIDDSAPGEVNASGYTVGGLLNGTVYIFELRAVNLVDEGRESEAVEVVMPLDPAYWSNFLAGDLQGIEAGLERGPFGGGPQSLRLRFGAGLRFEESELDGEGEVTATRMGSYGYRYTSRTTGELRLDFDGEESCELRLTFRGEGAGSYRYRYRCGGAFRGQGSFALTGLNRVPEISGAGLFEVTENQARVGQLEAVDGDDEIAGYGIAGGADGELFGVVEETGELLFGEAPDYENPGDVESEDPPSGAGDNEYVVVVEVRSGEGERERRGQRAIRVRVSDEEEPPEITSVGPFEVVENQAMVVQLEAVDPDEGDGIEGYGIAGGADGGLFAVEAETGELMFREAPDYETPGDVESAEPESGAGDNEYVVVVEVRSGEGERERKGNRAIRVRVADEEEPPEITSVGPFEVVENQTRVGQLEAVDQDKQDEITEYGIAGGADGELFAVEAETGELMFREAPDYENPSDVESAEPESGAGDNEYVVMVEARSGEGERERKGERAIRVRVSDEEEPPEALAAPAVTPEGTDSLKVSWAEPENRGPAITDYEVRYREEGEEGYSDGGHEGTGLTVTLSGLKEETLYEVQVRAANEEGIGEWSEPGEGRTETTKPDADDPSNFTGEDLEGRHMTLRLEGEEGAAGSLELRFGEDNRFEQIESGGEQAATRSEGVSRSGTYTYERTGPRMGRLGLGYDDGSSCELLLTFTESGLGAFAFDCGDGNPAEGSFRLTTGSLFIPVILSSAGRNDSFFTSEMTLTNRGEQDVSLDYTYTAERGGGSGTASEVLPAGRQRVKSNALGYLIGLGVPIPETGNRIGTLRVEVPLGSEVEAVVRTTTVVPGGRAGLAYLGVAEEEGFTEAVYLCGLRQNSRDRSNLAFQNMGAPEAGAITLRATVYSGDAADATARVLEDITLEPGGFHQYSPVLGVLESADGDRQGYVKVERVEGTAPFYAYGVINDQANSDGSFVFPVTASSLEGKMGQTLPVIVETSEFTSELTVTNFSEESTTLDFQFVSEQIKGDDKTASFSMTLEAGEQQIIPEVVEELRREGVAGLGSTRGFYAGPLFVEAEDGDMSGIVIGARTGSEGGGGSYSVFYNAEPEGEAFIREAWVDGLQQNEENRSNLALVNTGEVDGSASVFHLEIYDGETGMLVETVVTRPIAARRWHQINGILGSYAPETRQGYIRIEKVSGQNPFLAYGVVNDGGAPGERSGDGAYLPARE